MSNAPLIASVVARVPRARRLGVILVLSLLGVVVEPALAAPKKGPPQPDTKPVEQSYLLPYILTAGAVGIGLGVLLIPSQRKDDPND